MTEQIILEKIKYIKEFFKAEIDILDGHCEVLNYSDSFLQVKVDKEYYVKIKTFENYLGDKKMELYGIYFLDDKLCMDIKKPVVKI